MLRHALPPRPSFMDADSPAGDEMDCGGTPYHAIAKRSRDEELDAILMALQARPPSACACSCLNSAAGGSTTKHTAIKNFLIPGRNNLNSNQKDQPPSVLVLPGPSTHFSFRSLILTRCVPNFVSTMAISPMGDLRSDRGQRRGRLQTWGASSSSRVSWRE